MISQVRPTVEHEIGSAGSVSVRGLDGSIEVRAVDGPGVRLWGTGDRPLGDDYRVEAEPGALQVEAIRPDGIGWRRLGGRRVQGLVLEVPRGASVRIETASGDVHADGLQGDQRYRTVSGDLRLTDVAGRVVVDGVSGNVALRADARLELEARVVSADLDVRAPELAGVRIKTTSGDLRLEGALVEGASHSIETVSGDTVIAPSGPIRVEGRTVSGDVRTGLPHRSDGRPGRRTIEVGDGGALVSFWSISGGLTVVEPTSVGGPGPASAGPGTTPVGVRPDGPPLEPDDHASDRLAVLRDLEAGRIDVTEAGRRLATLDATPEDRARTEPIPERLPEPSLEGTPNDA